MAAVVVVVIVVIFLVIDRAVAVASAVAGLALESQSKRGAASEHGLGALSNTGREAGNSDADAIDVHSYDRVRPPISEKGGFEELRPIAKHLHEGIAMV